MDTHDRPFDPPEALRRVAPFAGTVLLAFGAAALPPAGNVELEIVAAGLTGLIIASTLVMPWGRLPSGAQSIPPLMFLVVIALLREAEGGATSGYAPLLFLPIVWLALHGTRQAMWICLSLVVAVLVIPIITIGSPHYPPSEWRRVIMLAGIAPLVGLTTQRLVREVWRQASDSALDARTDPLTGLANRRSWDESLSREVARAHRTSSPVSVAMLDMDHFKRFNDSHGHQAGDRLLREAAAAWNAEARQGIDLLARLGGEEFGVLLPGADLDSATGMVERLRRATPDGITASAGVASWDRSESPAELLARADAALYEAKEFGRDRTSVAFPTR
jgi:diguanylate cyclase (GGDEF)-like protein